MSEKFVTILIMGVAGSGKTTIAKLLSKKFNVEISKKYSLQDAAQAHKDLEARILTGPAVIVP